MKRLNIAMAVSLSLLAGSGCDFKEQFCAAHPTHWYCTDEEPGNCRMTGQSCVDDVDVCCDFPFADCIHGTCQDVPDAPGCKAAGEPCTDASECCITSAPLCEVNDPNDPNAESVCTPAP
jgi:hypothetical protein